MGSGTGKQKSQLTRISNEGCDPKWPRGNESLPPPTGIEWLLVACASLFQNKTPQHNQHQAPIPTPSTLLISGCCQRWTPQRVDSRVQFGCKCLHKWRSPQPKTHGTLFQNWGRARAALTEARFLTRTQSVEQNKQTQTLRLQSANHKLSSKPMTALRARTKP